MNNKLDAYERLGDTFTLNEYAGIFGISPQEAREDLNNKPELLKRLVESKTTKYTRRTQNETRRICS